MLKLSSPPFYAYFWHPDSIFPMMKTLKGDILRWGVSRERPSPIISSIRMPWNVTPIRWLGFFGTVWVSLSQCRSSSYSPRPSFFSISCSQLAGKRRFETTRLFFGSVEFSGERRRDGNPWFIFPFGASKRRCSAFDESTRNGRFVRRVL